MGAILSCEDFQICGMRWSLGHVIKDKRAAGMITPIFTTKAYNIADI